MKMNLNLAVNELRRAKAMHEHNAPLHDLANLVEQARLCREVARQCQAAIDLIERNSADPPEEAECA